MERTTVSRAAGQQDGSKDPPCAIVLTTKHQPDGSYQVLLAPITHSPGGTNESGVEIPAKVSRHLGLDDDRSWIKTHEVNLLYSEQGKTPYGITPVKRGERSYGELPRALSEQVISQIRERLQERSPSNVRRDFPDDKAKSWEATTGRGSDDDGKKLEKTDSQVEKERRAPSDQPDNKRRR